jgi:hypothetical protein
MPAPKKIVRAVAPLAFSDCEWIPSLAEPYLRGYTPQRERGTALAGYRFAAPGSGAPRPGPHSLSTGRRKPPAAGFFLGYLTDERGFPFLRPAPPECLVYCFIEPVGGALHRRLMREPASLMPRTAEYIGWLTHRPPRFELFAEEPVVLVRHTSMRDWPREKLQHFSRNFFIETLAWLVRSALVRRLPGELKSSVFSVTSGIRKRATSVL